MNDKHEDAPPVRVQRGVSRTAAIQFAIIGLVCCCAKGKDTLGSTLLLLIAAGCAVAVAAYWPMHNSSANTKRSDDAHED